MTRLIRFSNNAVSRLAANLAVGGTSISLTPGEGSKFPTLTGSQFFMGTLVKSDGTTEIVKVTARATDTLTVVRAAEPVAGSSTAYAFTAGDRFELRLTAGATGDEFDRLDDAATNGTLATGTWNINVSGNAATATNATSAAACTGNSATATNATSAAACTGNSATVTNGVYTTGDQTVGGTKTFSSAPVIPGVNGGQLAGMRNKVINGSIKVDQRNAGASQTFTAAAALAYCVDRFYGYCTGANITGQRIALSNGQNRYSFTGAASNTAVGFGHRIEAVNCLDLAGSTATFSVKLSSSSLTTITWTAYYANTADKFGTLASPTRTQIATGTFTINSTEATYSTNISVPSAATTGIEIVLTGGALLAAQTLTIGDLQLEAGSVATPFEHRPYGTELALCQRYLPVIYKNSTTALGGLGQAPSGVLAIILVSYPVTPRVVPTGLSLDAAVGTYRVSTANGSQIALTALALDPAVTTNIGVLRASVASGMSVGQATYLILGGNLYFTGCEL